jgi:hypothetical protein
LFDLASAVGAEQEDRTLAAWTITPATVGKRDVPYQRGFPLPPDPDGTLVDRGHLIPHLSGGEFGPNIFRQRRDLNRGWPGQGKRFRALEREAAATSGTFYFGHLLYQDGTGYPTEIETGLLRGETLQVDRFGNRCARWQSAHGAASPANLARFTLPPAGGHFAEAGGLAAAGRRGRSCAWRGWLRGDRGELLLCVLAEADAGDREVFFQVPQ